MAATTATPQPARERSRALVSAADVRQLGKAGLTAVVLRLIIGIVKSIAKHALSRRTVRALRDELLGTDPWKWACVFMGWAAFKPLCRVLEAGVSAAVPSVSPAVSAQAATITAAAVAAQPIRVMLMSTRTELALYLASRASHSIASNIVLPKCPAPLRNFGHWDVFFVGLSGAQILYALLFEHNTHSAAYRTFLENCVMIPRNFWDTVAAFHRGQMSPQVLWRADSVNVPQPAGVGKLSDLCTLMHPHTASCDLNAVQWGARHMMRFSVPLYLPLKVLTTLAFGWKRVLQNPVGQATKILWSVVQSSLFLTLYCGVPLRTVCVFSQLGFRSEVLMGLLAGVGCGLPTFLEPKGRRLDLALYCNMHAFRSFVLMLNRRGIIGRPRGHHVMMLYTAALTVLLHFLRFRPADLHPNLRSLFTWIVGSFDK